MQTLLQNIRYALRQLRKSPGFSLTVVLTLALGVGANAVVFSVLNALILRPLPLPQADRLVSFNRIGGSTGNLGSSPSQSYPDYRHLRDDNNTFSGVAGFRITRAGVGTTGAVQQSWIYEATENYFDVLGTQPAIGRFYHPSDAHGPNSSPYAVLSYSYWQRHFNGDPHVLGTVLELNKHSFIVLGVAPKGFSGTELALSADLWVPFLNQEQVDGYSDLEERGNHNIWLIGRLKPGVTVAQAEGDINVIGKRLAAQYKEDEGLAFTLSRPGLIGDTLGRPVRAFLFGVMGLAALVLLAACANLGSLFSARAADRARELAVRIALGASRSILIRQLVTEAVLVSLVGGVVGLFAAEGLLSALSQWRVSPDFPLQVMVNADARVFALAILLSVACGLFFGLLPVRQIWRGSAYILIKSGPAAVSGNARWTLRDMLLVVQIVLCSVLVTSSLVAVRGLVRSLHTSYGFQPEGAVLAQFDTRMVGLNDEPGFPLQRRALDAVAALPGVTAAGFADTVPLTLGVSDSDAFRDGTTDFRDSNAAADAYYFHISPGYLAAAQTQLLVGRDFTWHDDANAPLVAIVNQTFARMVFGSGIAPRDAIGRHFLRGGKKRWEVVGVVEDGKYFTLTERPSPAMFFPTAQSFEARAMLVVRSHDSEAATAAAVHSTLTGIDPNLPVMIQGWPESLGVALFPSVAATCALGIMGALAAMLAITGIFGMASYSVSKRLRELGLRMALGAQRKQVLAAALGRPARLLLYGSIAGLALGAMTSRLLAHVVYQATSQDPLVLGGVILSMGLIALVATWLPARRALHVDPAKLLREE